MAARLHPADYGASISLWRGEEVIAADFAAVVGAGVVKVRPCQPERT